MQKSKHVTWDLCYHVVIEPKYRKKILYGRVKERLGQILRKLSSEKGVEILEGNMCSDHVHMMLRIPPKYRVAEVMGFLKGKSSIRLHNEFRKGKMLSGKKFWSRGYFVRSSGIDQDDLRKYIQDQWDGDKRDDGSQLDFNW